MQKNNKGFDELNIKHGLKDGLPIGLGYLSVSFAFGVQASILGVPAFMSLFISMTNLTSAGQLAGLTIIASIGTILEMILSQLVINARYFLMSITLSQKLGKEFNLMHRFLASAFITDEIFAVASAKPQTLNKKYFYGLVILPYIGWSLGTILGALAGDILPSEITNALGIALYAMFIAIIALPSVKNTGVLVAVVLSAGISCAMFFIPVLSKVSSGLAVIISAVIASAIVAYFFPINKEEKEQ
ncbi:MAG: AzlC family ABC transporter permease [Clostridia bacterium]|nr:AzlC family ABC transporter permease [Clostridia bacterium]